MLREKKMMIKWGDFWVSLLGKKTNKRRYQGKTLGQAL